MLCDFWQVLKGHPPCWRISCFWSHKLPCKKFYYPEVTMLWGSPGYIQALLTVLRGFPGHVLTANPPQWPCPFIISLMCSKEARLIWTHTPEYPAHSELSVQALSCCWGTRYVSEEASQSFEFSQLGPKAVQQRQIILAVLFPNSWPTESKSIIKWLWNYCKMITKYYATK